MSLKQEQALENIYLMHTYGRSPVEFVGGEGMQLIGDDGRRYLDFLSGIGVCCLGHGGLPNRVVEEQAAKLMLSALSDAALRPVPQQYRDGVRAAIFKQMLISTIS